MFFWSSRQLSIRELLHVLMHKVNHIMATQAEMAQSLRTVAVQQQKTIGEIKGVQSAVDALNARIAELEAIVTSSGDASAELVDAVTAVVFGGQAVDDAIPDAPAPVPTP